MIGENSKAEQVHDRSNERRIVTSTISVVLLIGMGVVVEMLLFSGLDYDLFLRIVAVTILMLTVARSNPFPLLLALLAKLFFREPGSIDVEITSGSLLYSLIALIAIAMACKFQALVIWLSEFWWECVGDRATIDQPRTMILRSWLARWCPTAFWYLAGSIGLVMAARLLLARVPIGNRVGIWYQWAVNHDGMIWPGPALILLAMAVAIVLGELSWRQMTREQASMYVRSQSIRFLYPEFRSVILKSIRWQRKKKS